MRSNPAPFLLIDLLATLVVGVSRQVNDGLIADGLAPERTRVIYNGIDFARFNRPPASLRATLGIAAEAFVVTTAGSLIRRKGHDVLIRAFHAMPQPLHRRHLLVYGDGPERQALQTLAASLGIAGQVHFLGHTKNFSEIYEGADVFALASRGDAFGLVLAEAGYLGLPVVATRVGGIPEVVAHDETGVLVPPDDVAAFSAALSRFMDDPMLRTQMGQAATERVAGLFSVEQMARRFEETYATLARIPAAQLGWSRNFRTLRPYVKLLTTLGQRSKPRYAS